MEEKQYIKAYVEKVSDDEINIVATDESIDREGEKIVVSGWKLDNFKKNPVLLWSHNAGLGEQRPAIGIADKLKEENKKITFIPIFDMADQFAANIARKVKEGFINAVSVGFLPLERDENNEAIIKSAELLEISFVNIPANPNALIQMRSAGIPISKDWKDWKEGSIEYPDEKGVVGTHTTPTASIDSSWDGSDARRSLLEWAGGRENTNFSKFKRGFAWFDTEDADNLGAYKLPHHIVDNGELKVVFRGVSAAMAALLGARGGVDIPDSDRQGVYRHLSRHHN